MIPYVIICKSCSAKLKVSVPELIGQTVDCPKCSTELTLTPPDGYENPLANSTTNKFDDLDDLLGNNQDSSVAKEQHAPPTPATMHAPKPKERFKQLPKTKPGQSRAKLSTGVPEPKQKRQTAETQSLAIDPAQADALDSPMLPDGSWEGESLKKRKRLIQYGLLFVLGFVFAAIGVFFLTGGNDTAPTPEAVGGLSMPKGDDDSPSVDQPKVGKVETDSDAGSNTTNDTAVAAPASVSDFDGGEAVAVRGAADFAAPAINDSGFGAPSSQQPATPLPSPPTADDAAMSKPKQTNALAKSNDVVSADDTTSVKERETGSGDSFIKKPTKESPLVPGRKSRSEFARALEEAGTVLSEIQDQALLQREAALIGLPKYFVEPPDEDPVKVAKQLAVAVSGVKFDESPVLDVLFELENLSGVPVSFDWDAGEVRAADYSQTISMITKDESFESLFATIASKLKLNVVADDRGVTFTRGKPLEVTEHTWDLSPKLSEASVGELKGFIVRTWPLDAAVADFDESVARKELAESVVVASNKVSLACDADMRARLDDLIAGMTEAAKPESAQLTMADPVARPTVFKIDPVLDRALDLAKDNEFRVPYRIGSLLRRIREQAGLKIFIDWTSLRSQGWSPNTRIPGNFNEATCRDALQQLARSLKASWIVIDESTVLMTSFEASRAKSETEVYPVKHLLQKNLTAGELKRVLEDTLSSQLQMPGVSVVYFGEYDCLIAHAPQSVHRQLYSILNRLWEDLK